MLSIYNENPSSAPALQQLLDSNLIQRLKALEETFRANGPESLHAKSDLLVRIGTEVNGDGEVTKNSYGHLSLPWQAERHPEWATEIQDELSSIKKAMRAAHGVSMKYLIWAGMGGSAEDKVMYKALGLLRTGPRIYILDSTDPAKLKSILADMLGKSGKRLPDILKTTLVVGMALGMTSYEPVLNLQKLAALYRKFQIDSQSNFIYMTLPGSLLDQFGKSGGYRKVELQLDSGNSTSGRHSAPMTRGSLYPLGFAGVDLDSWMKGTLLPAKEVDEAFQLSAFLRTQCRAGRDKVTLLLPKAWLGVSIWTKQNFEESLGKSEDFGIKIVTGESAKLANYRSPRDGQQDRCFLAIQVKGQTHSESKKISALRRAGYPLAVLTLGGSQLSRYMQLIHYAVFGIGYLEEMNFVTQPGVELYKAITNRLHAESEAKGGIDKTEEWIAAQSSARRAKYRGGIALFYDRLPASVNTGGKDAATVYANILRSLITEHKIEYGELTFFGDIRYSEQGRGLLKVLTRAGNQVFRSALHRPVDIYEGPAMNHSFHEMIIGHGRCLSTVLISEKSESLPEAGYTADYHRAQFLATQMALAEKGRMVVSMVLKDLEQPTLSS